MKLFRSRKPSFRQHAPGHLAGTDLLWLLGSLCQLHRIPFDPLLIERQFPPPCSIATIHNALHALGFKTGDRAVPIDAVGLSKLTLPVVGFLVIHPQEQPSGRVRGTQRPEF